MSITKVSDAFAFVLEQGEFTETILFAKDEIPELKADERDAVAAVLKHVEASYVSLLSECRQAFLDLAQGTALDANRKILESNESRPSTIWNRGAVQVPLLIGNSWVAWVGFGLWPTSEKGRPIKLGGHITTQKKRFAELAEVLRQRKVEVRPVWSGHGVEPVLPKEGETFRTLAEEMAKRTVPIAADLYAALTKKKE
jgi:hypothetical protein